MSSAGSMRNGFSSPAEGRTAPPGGDQAGQGLRRHEAQAPSRRQDGRPPRQQGCDLEDPSRRGPAHLPDEYPVEIVLNPLGVPSRMNVGQILEPTSGGPGASWGRSSLPRVRRRQRGGDKEYMAKAGLPSSGKTRLFDGVTGEAAGEEGHRWLHLHAEAVPPGGRQDPRSVDRPVLADYPAAPGRQGAVRWPTLRRDGGMGPRGLRRSVHPAGAADRQVATM